VAQRTSAQRCQAASSPPISLEELEEGGGKEKEKRNSDDGDLFRFYFRLCHRGNRRKERTPQFKHGEKEYSSPL